MSIRMRLRRDTAANWSSSDPVLGVGEVGLETDTQTFKVGDGVSAWSALVYWAAGDVQSVAGLTGVISASALIAALALTKGDVGLGNVDNTSDANKPVSTAQAAADAVVAATAAAAVASEASTRAAADTSEANTRAAAITSEANARIAGDAAAQAAAEATAAAALAAEASTRATADTNEASARASGDAAAQAAAEATAAAALAAHVGTGGTAHANAVASGAAGFMTGTDKAKLDGIASGATAYTDALARSAVVVDSIADADTTHAPSRNAVFDALALKADATNAAINTLLALDPALIRATLGVAPSQVVFFA